MKNPFKIYWNFVSKRTKKVKKKLGSKKYLAMIIVCVGISTLIPNWISFLIPSGLYKQIFMAIFSVTILHVLVLKQAYDIWGGNANRRRKRTSKRMEAVLQES